MSFSYEFLSCDFVQLKSGGHTGNHEQQQHKPGVNHILEQILRLICTERADDAVSCDAVEYVNHMIDYHKAHCNPTDIVEVCLSHNFTTFAIILYTIIKNKLCPSHQAKFTFLHLSVKFRGIVEWEIILIFHHSLHKSLIYKPYSRSSFIKGNS